MRNLVALLYCRWHFAGTAWGNFSLNVKSHCKPPKNLLKAFWAPFSPLICHLTLVLFCPEMCSQKECGDIRHSHFLKKRLCCRSSCIISSQVGVNIRIKWELLWGKCWVGYRLCPNLIKWWVNNPLKEKIEKENGTYSANCADCIFSALIRKKEVQSFCCRLWTEWQSENILKLQHLAGRGNHLTCSVNKKV